MKCQLRTGLTRIAMLLVATGNAMAGGLGGDLINGIGQVTRIAPIEKFGKELDNAHRDLKNAKGMELYKAIEEKSSTFVRKRFRNLCTIPFQSSTQIQIGHCSNWGGRLDDQDLIQDAIRALAGTGKFQIEEFSGVQIRWCPLIGGPDGRVAHGIAADRGRVYLNSSQKNHDPIDVATLLAHEMKHVRQYRGMGTDEFKCKYSQEYVKCGGCQDRGHSLEREAYDFEDQIRQLLNQAPVQSATRHELQRIESGAYENEQGLRVCNKSKKRAYVAIGFDDGDNHAASHGWWIVEPRKCELIPYEGDIAVYAYATLNPRRRTQNWLPAENVKDTLPFCVAPREYFNFYGDDCGWRGDPMRLRLMGYLTEGRYGVFTWDLEDQ
jgi:uncharacterized membrane protein